MGLDYRRWVERARAHAPIVRTDEERAELLASASAEPSSTPYARTSLHRDDVGEVMLATWARDAACAVHDHGGSGGLVQVLEGEVVETRYRWDASRGLVAGPVLHHAAGATIRVARDAVHAMRAVGATRTLHVYGPAPETMRVHDLDARVSYEVGDGHGAWLPVAASAIRRLERFEDVAARRARPVVLVGYTTHYREGSAEFERAAATLAARLARELPEAEIRLLPMRWKRDFVSAVESLAEDARTLQELHFVGHSGMYGIMFGSTEFPEQLSPHEWRTLRAPFAEGGRAVFHACRTGRWFAPFVARTLGIEAAGYHGYTTVSLDPERFVWDAPWLVKDRPLHVIACDGRKSHGLVGALRKHAGRAAAHPLRRFEPEPADEAPSYDRVATTYDAAFADIRVRAPELRFVEHALAHLGPGPLRVLDVGCGNGAMLGALAPRLALGVGVDASSGMIARASHRQRAHRHLSFEVIEGPELPFEDASFDAVVSFLSFRYLDWDPMVRSMARVLRPGGRLVIVDMVDKPIELREMPLFVRSTARHLATRVRHRRFVERLERLTRDPAWQRMLSYNPIRAEHEYRWYLESRFPGRRLEVLSASRTARVVAFDSGPKDAGWRLTPMSFP